MLHINRMRWLVLLAVLLLSACGFHLRGSGTTAALPFKTVYLGMGDTPLGIELKRAIGNSGSTTVVADVKAAQAIIDVNADSRDKAILSLNSQGRVREYTLSYRVVFRVRDKETELLAPTEIVLRRILNFNEAQVLAKEAEEASLYRDLQSEMVQQMLRRIAAIKNAAPAASSPLLSPGTTTAK